MLIEQNFNFDATNIFQVANGYRIVGSGNPNKNIFLSPTELFLDDGFKKLGTRSITLFSLSGFTDSTLGANFRTPLFCKTIRDYEKEVLKQKSFAQIAECIDDMKTLHTMFPDCKKTTAMLNGNLRILNEIFQSVAQK